MATGRPGQQARGSEWGRLPSLSHALPSLLSGVRTHGCSVSRTIARCPAPGDGGCGGLGWGLSPARADPGREQHLLLCLNTLFPRSLKCCHCVVVGNGHRLRNSSLGDAIDKYDVVIRSVWPSALLGSGVTRPGPGPR